MGTLKLVLTHFMILMVQSQINWTICDDGSFSIMKINEAITIILLIYLSEQLRFIAKCYISTL